MMDPIVISKDSWHYKLLSKMCNKRPNDLCEYSRTLMFVLFGLFALFGLACFLAVAALFSFWQLGNFLGFLAAYVTHSARFVDSVNDTIGGAILFVAIGAGTIMYALLHFKVKAPTTPPVFKAMWTGFKNKVCFKIEYR